MANHTNESQAAPRMGFLDYLKAVGPALVVSAVVVGPGSVTTASQMGARYEYAMLWIVLLAAIAGFFYQLPAVRITLHTGNSIMESVRIRYGKPVSVPFFYALLFGTCVFQAGNFIGAAMAMNWFIPAISINAWTMIMVLMGFALVWIGKHNILENFTKVLIFLMVIAFLITAFASNPEIGRVATQGFSFNIPGGDYMLVLAMLATTMVPDIPVQLSSLIKQKYCGDKTRESRFPLKTKSKLAHTDLIVGCITTMLITSSIIICSGTNLFPLGIEVTGAADMAAQLTPILGRYAGVLFSLGLWAAAFSSGMFRIALMPMFYNQATGQETDMKATRSRIFTIVPAAVPILVVLLFGSAPAALVIMAQAINGIILPFVAAVIWKLSSDKKYLGQHANKPWLNVVFGLIFIAAAALAIRTFVGFF